MSTTLEDSLAKIKETVTSNKVVLYMKGTPQAPMCGFSAQVVNILDHLGVEFLGQNILEDEGIRQAIKVYSDWPTLPQLYIDGELVGGCDITTEMFQSGELQTLLGRP
jgi:monothiol glutaredoxin